MNEQQIQSKIKKKLEANGYIVINLIKTSMNGIPDLMCLKDGKIMFIEVKKTNGVLSQIQKIRLKQLKDKGFKCYVWTDLFVDFNWDGEEIEKNIANFI